MPAISHEQIAGPPSPCCCSLPSLNPSCRHNCRRVPQNGFDGWLAKPFRVEEFARVLAACRSGAALTPKRPS